MPGASRCALPNLRATAETGAEIFLGGPLTVAVREGANPRRKQLEGGQAGGCPYNAGELEFWTRIDYGKRESWNSDNSVSRD